MEKLKEIWTKVKVILNKIASLFKKIVQFLKKYGKWFLHGINLIVIGLAYDVYSDSLLVGGWLFILLAYYIFWKILRAETLFQKDEDE